MEIVELTGIPGSGKSSLLPVAKKHIRKMGVDVFDTKDIVRCGDRFPFNVRLLNRLLEFFPSELRETVLRRLTNVFNLKNKYQVDYLISHFQLVKWIIDITDSRPIPEHHKQFIIKSFLKTGGSYQIANHSSQKDFVLIMDEGFVHKAVTFFVSIEETNINFLEIEEYLEKIPKVQTLIKVEADSTLCKNRIIGRKVPLRLEGKTDNEILEYLHRAQSVISYAVDILSKKGTRIVTVNNSGEEFIKENIMSQLLANFRCS